MKKLTYALFVFAHANFAFAEGSSKIDKIENAYTSCMNNATSTLGYKNCIGTAYDEADAELNKVYKSITSPLKKQNDPDSVEILKRLVEAQRAWITFRDANCKLAGIQMLNGSGESPIVGGCIVTSTISRVRELQNLFGDQ